MSADQWSWLAALVTVIGVWLGGFSPRVGWIYGIGSQCVWASYGLATDQRGMVALSLVMTLIFIRNLRRWRGHKFTAPKVRERRSEDGATERA